MRYDLRALAKQAGYRRKLTRFRPIVPPTSMALEYYRVIRPVNDQVAARIPAIMEQYRITLAQLTTDSAQSVSQEISAIEAFGISIGVTFSRPVQQWIERVERWHRGKWSNNVLRPSNVDLGTSLTAGDVRETLASYLADNVNMIKGLNADQARKISGIVFRGLNNRLPARDVAKEIREVMGASRRRALLIASDQLQKLTSALDRERMVQAGLDEYEWWHSGKLNFRPAHKARDKKRFKLGEPKGDEPGMAIRCGCKRGPIMSFE